MTIDDQIKNEKLQYDTKREATKISTLSSGNNDKHEYVTSEEILPSDQSRIIEQAKFIYSSLVKEFEKQIKTIKDQEIKQVENLKVLKPEENKQDIKSIEEIFPKDMRTNEIKNEICEIKKWEENIEQEILKDKQKITHIIFSSI